MGMSVAEHRLNSPGRRWSCSQTYNCFLVSSPDPTPGTLEGLGMRPESCYRVHAPIVRQPVLWDIHTNKCGRGQLLCPFDIPCEIYQVINCIHYILYFKVIACITSLYWKNDQADAHLCTIQQNACFLECLTALSLHSHLCLTSKRTAMDISLVKKASWLLFLCWWRWCLIIQTVSHNTFRNSVNKIIF